MRPQRGGRPPASPPQTVKQLLKVLRQQQGAGDRPPPGTAVSPLLPPAGPSVPVAPAPAPPAATWSGAPSAAPSAGACGVPAVPHGGPGGPYGAAMPNPGGCQAAAPFGPPGPAWALPAPGGSLGPGGAPLGPLPDPDPDPEPAPGELAAARAAVRAMDPRELLRQDEEGDTLLHVLCARGLRAPARAAAEAFEALGQLELREHRGKTPLLVAGAAAAAGVVGDLLALGADADAADHRGRTLLHLAATYGLPRVLRAVMASGVPVNVEARNFEGQTPLHCAVLSHNASLRAGGGGGGGTPQDRLLCVELLLRMGADCASQDMKSSQTVLHLAVRGGNLALAHLLLRQPGAAPRLVNAKAHGNTPLHMAAALPGGPSQEPLVRLLLAWGADAGARNLEHDLPHGLLPPGPPGDQLRLLLKSRRTARRPSPAS
ncbi:NF-kappa-B inhibitor delta [Dromaius novaehollandiae]|uniref:NF-kappa-B inhibitor delta n=1 Tax=Dromaius novaehollandiae TaxID=8790 RepID=UPI00311FCA6C